MINDDFANNLLYLFNEFSRAKLVYRQRRQEDDCMPIQHFENPDNFGGFMTWLVYRSNPYAKAKKLREG